MKGALILALVVCAQLIVGVTPSDSSQGVHQWPSVQPATATFHLVDHRNMEAKLQVMGGDGRPLYLLVCYLNAYDFSDKDFDYSGDFECRLISLVSKERYSTLLTEETAQSRDWQSRGRFLLEEITGKCAAYPEYGTLRHFRLRGMELTLRVKQFTMEAHSSGANNPWNRNRIKDLTLEVSVAPAPSASSEIAEVNAYTEPARVHPKDPHDLSRNCDTVLRR